MVYLSIEEVVVLHDVVIGKTGGSLGVRDVDLLHSAVERPKSSYGGLDLYGNIWLKGSSLLHSLIKNHPFVDGNKRTGLLAASVFLEMNGYKLVMEDEDGYTFVMEMSMSDVELEKIAEWLESHAKKVR